MRVAELERAAARNRLIRESRGPSRRDRRVVRRRLAVRRRPRSRFASHAALASAFRTRGGGAAAVTVTRGRWRIRFVAMAPSALVVSGDFDLTMDELRVVARYVAWHAEDVLPVFEQAVSDDPRPRAAVDAARVFINGANRTRLQRVTSLDAHRAARSAPSEASRLAARSAGDAASAAYLHPIAQASQIGHILRAAASAAYIQELAAGWCPRARGCRVGTVAAAGDTGAHRRTPPLPRPQPRAVVGSPS